MIRSDPGVGIVKDGWHCGGDPQVVGSGEEAHVDFDIPPIVLCKNEPFEFKATGGPGPSIFRWPAPGGSTPDQGHVITETGSNVSSTFTTTFNTEGKHTITVEFECDSGARVEKFIEVEVLPETQTTGNLPMQRLPLLPDLTDKEWDLTLENPAQAFNVNRNRAKPLQEARSRFKDYIEHFNPERPTLVPDGTAANAFLHLAWVYLNATNPKIGPNLAKQFSDAHEDFPTNPCADPNTGGSKFMDLNNDNLALIFATDPEFNKLSLNEVFDRFEEKARAGNVFTIIPNPF